MIYPGTGEPIVTAQHINFSGTAHAQFAEGAHTSLTIGAHAQRGLTVVGLSVWLRVGLLAIPAASELREPEI